jgi:hypothetical protein
MTGGGPPSGEGRAAWPVRVRGVLGGATLDAAAELLLAPAHVRLRHAAGDVALPWASLDGAMADGPVLVLVGRDGTAVRCEGLPNARAVAEEVRELGTDVPELTRSLRGFASIKGAPGADHDTFFGPLLEARRALHAARSAAERLAAFDARRVSTALEASRLALAARRWPAERDAGNRRALHAEMEDLMAPVHRALDGVALAADAWRSSPDAAVLRTWRAWCAAVGAVWVAADSAWLAAMPALADSRGASGAFWRRVLGKAGK